MCNGLCRLWHGVMKATYSGLSRITQADYYVWTRVYSFHSATMLKIGPSTFSEDGDVLFGLPVTFWIWVFRVSSPRYLAEVLRADHGGCKSPTCIARQQITRMFPTSQYFGSENLRTVQRLTQWAALAFSSILYKWRWRPATPHVWILKQSRSILKYAFCIWNSLYNFVIFIPFRKNFSYMYLEAHAPSSHVLSLSHYGHPLRVLSCKSVCLHSLFMTKDL